MLHYTAQCDQDTILNLTNHSYFNLDGEGTVQEQLLKIHADRYTPNDAGCLPTGELAPVAGTAMDFRAFKPIGKDADSDEPCVKPFRGYDVNFCLDGSVPAIEAKSLKSGIVMCVTTDQPGVQLFTANHMKERIGKTGSNTATAPRSASKRSISRTASTIRTGQAASCARARSLTARPSIRLRRNKKEGNLYG